MAWATKSTLSKSLLQKITLYYLNTLAYVLIYDQENNFVVLREPWQIGVICTGNGDIYRSLEGLREGPTARG